MKLARGNKHSHHREEKKHSAQSHPANHSHSKLIKKLKLFNVDLLDEKKHHAEPLLWDQIIHELNKTKFNFLQAVRSKNLVRLQDAALHLSGQLTDTLKYLEHHYKTTIQPTLDTTKIDIESQKIRFLSKFVDDLVSYVALLDRLPETDKNIKIELFLQKVIIKKNYAAFKTQLHHDRLKSRTHEVATPMVWPKSPPHYSLVSSVFKPLNLHEKSPPPNHKERITPLSRGKK